MEQHGSEMDKSYCYHGNWYTIFKVPVEQAMESVHNFLSIGIGVAVVVYIAPVMFNQNSDLINSASDTAKMIN